MPDDSNTVNRQESYRINRGKIDAERQKSEKIENKVRQEENSEQAPQKLT